MGALKKNNCPPPVQPNKSEQKRPTLDTAENVIMKAEIERMRKLLSEKIKDPKLAKKAAMIISEMLDQSKK